MLLNLIRKKPKKINYLPFKYNYATDSAKFNTKKYRLHNLDKGPESSVTLQKNDALEYYKQMFAIRRLETVSANMYQEKLIRGFCHLYSGQEAVAVGIKSVLRPQDAVITAYRAHGWTYLMGVPFVGVLAELAGKQSGCSRGKGGSMHMYGQNFYGGNGIVGAQVPLGAGVAMALKYQDKKGVCVTLYGDGASNQGQVFEAYNLSKLWKLPAIFVCENNGYGMGTRCDRSSATTDYYTRGQYIPGLYVDGMDVLTVREATRFALDYCLSDKGPIVLETATYRYHGHSMSDPGTSYRSRDEIKEVREAKDPITSFKDQILSVGLVTEEELTKIDKEVRDEVDDAAKKVRADKEIDMDELTADVYAKALEPKIRGVTYYQSQPHKNVVTPINLK